MGPRQTDRLDVPVGLLYGTGSSEKIWWYDDREDIANMSGSKGHSERIIRDARICAGDPVFKGTRVTLRTVLASLAEGDSAEQIIADFPALQPEDIKAAIAFAAASAEEDLPIPPLPQVQ